MKTLEEKLEKVLERIDVLESKLGIKQDQKSNDYIGKWYKHPNNEYPNWLVYYGENKKCYGFRTSWAFDDDSENEWYGYLNEFPMVKATPKEVEEALIKEAKKRGFINGAIANNSSIHKSQLLNFNVDFEYYFYDEFSNELRLMTGVVHSWYTIFKNGIWADVIEVDKFAELKEAHKNGSVIECLQSDGEWFEIEDPQWQTVCEYRIKPIKYPKVGDVCKFWRDYEDEYVVGILCEIGHESKHYKYHCTNSNWYKNVKVLTQEEVIKLLFKK